MSVTGINHYSSYTNAQERTANKPEVKKQDSAAGTTKQTSSEAYLKELSKRHEELNIMSGYVDTKRRGRGDGRVDVQIAPNILEEMASDPEKAKKYEQMLADIPKLNKWADSLIKSMTGSEVQYRQVWIDENGDMGSFVITAPSKEQQAANEMKKEREQKTADQRMEQRAERRKEEQIRFEKWLKKDGKIEIAQMSQEEIGKRMRFDVRM